MHLELLLLPAPVLFPGLRLKLPLPLHLPLLLGELLVLAIGLLGPALLFGELRLGLLPKALLLLHLALLLLLVEKGQLLAAALFLLPRLLHLLLVDQADALHLDLVLHHLFNVLALAGLDLFEGPLLPFDHRGLGDVAAAPDDAALTPLQAARHRLRHAPDPTAGSHRRRGLAVRAIAKCLSRGLDELGVGEGAAIGDSPAAIGGGEHDTVSRRISAYLLARKDTRG